MPSVGFKTKFSHVSGDGYVSSALRDRCGHESLDGALHGIGSGIVCVVYDYDAVLLDDVQPVGCELRHGKACCRFLHGHAIQAAYCYCKPCVDRVVSSGYRKLHVAGLSVVFNIKTDAGNAFVFNVLHDEVAAFAAAYSYEPALDASSLHVHGGKHIVIVVYYQNRIVVEVLCDLQLGVQYAFSALFREVLQMGDAHVGNDGYLRFGYISQDSDGSFVIHSHLNNSGLCISREAGYGKREPRLAVIVLYGSGGLVFAAEHVVKEVSGGGLSYRSGDSDLRLKAQSSQIVCAKSLKSLHGIFHHDESHSVSSCVLRGFLLVGNDCHPASGAENLLQEVVSVVFLALHGKEHVSLSGFSGIDHRSRDGLVFSSCIYSAVNGVFQLFRSHSSHFYTLHMVCRHTLNLNCYLQTYISIHFQVCS